jgi:hypothetical protein
MLSRIATALALMLALCAPAARAATAAQPLMGLQQSVAGNETRTFSVRFTTATGAPAAGEKVSFSNDACGFYANGLFNTTVTTDANGVASAAFTAMPQGIVCHMVVSAGASVVFTVLTYLPANLWFDARLDPPQPKPGDTVTLSVAPSVGAYAIYEADVAAAVIAGTGNAALSAPGANTGQAGRVSFQLTPQGKPGDYEVEVSFHGHSQRIAVDLPDNPWQDMWLGGIDQNGWGMSVVQHRDTLFSVLYAYDAAGKPTWYVMPGGAWNTARTVYSGALYSPRGAPYTAYDASKFAVGSAVGTASIDVSDPAHVAFNYQVGNASGTKALSRQPFGPVDTAQVLDAGDMWWGGTAQDGWGLAVLQQYRSLFAVWFTYDASGAPTWFVMPSGAWSDTQTYSGRIYRTTGSPWLGAAYDAAKLATTDAGSFTLHFSTDGGTFDYTIDGKSGHQALVRQPF